MCNAEEKPFLCNLHLEAGGHKKGRGLENKYLLRATVRAKKIPDSIDRGLYNCHSAYCK